MIRTSAPRARARPDSTHSAHPSEAAGRRRGDLRPHGTRRETRHRPLRANLRRRGRAQASAQVRVDRGLTPRKTGVLDGHRIAPAGRTVLGSEPDHKRLSRVSDVSVAVSLRRALVDQSITDGACADRIQIIGVVATKTRRRAPVQNLKYVANGHYLKYHYVRVRVVSHYMRTAPNASRHNLSCYLTCWSRAAMSKPRALEAKSWWK